MGGTKYLYIINLSSYSHCRSLNKIEVQGNHVPRELVKAIGKSMLKDTVSQDG
jgi:hypothetical protein